MARKLDPEEERGFFEALARSAQDVRDTPAFSADEDPWPSTGPELTAWLLQQPTDRFSF